jgi:hypothetical protein
MVFKLSMESDAKSESKMGHLMNQVPCGLVVRTRVAALGKT